MPIEHSKVSQIIRADLKDVFDFVTDYENMPKWSKMFKNVKVLYKKGNTTKIECETRVLGIKFKGTVTGVIKPYEGVEEEVVSAGIITKDRLKFTKVPEGTRIDWSGEIVKLAGWMKIFAPLMKISFDKQVKKEFEVLAGYIESGKYKEI
jgi:hypothetical protein